MRPFTDPARLVGLPIWRLFHSTGWLPGTVASWLPDSGKHAVVYNQGGEHELTEVLDLQTPVVEMSWRDPELLVPSAPTPCGTLVTAGFPGDVGAGVTPGISSRPATSALAEGAASVQLMPQQVWLLCTCLQCSRVACFSRDHAAQVAFTGDVALT